MFRRQFFQRMTSAGAAGIAVAGMTEAGQYRKVTYRVRGFTCVTCAVGLETMLRREKGIVHVEASYPKAMVTIEFDTAEFTEDSLRKFIAEMGFSVPEGPGR